MTKRKAITPAMKIKALLSRYEISCGICHFILGPLDEIQWDHVHAISMDGPHEWENIRPTHARCNQAKGIREHKAAAKVKRILADKPSKRPMQNSGKPIPSRPFQKRRVRCAGCAANWADPPSNFCVGCQAYRGHQA